MIRKQREHSKSTADIDVVRCLGILKLNFEPSRFIQIIQNTIIEYIKYREQNLYSSIIFWCEGTISYFQRSNSSITILQNQDNYWIIFLSNHFQNGKIGIHDSGLWFFFSNFLHRKLKIIYFPAIKKKNQVIISCSFLNKRMYIVYKSPFSMSVKDWNISKIWPTPWLLIILN